MSAAVSASRGELRAIAFCFEDTATQIRDSLAEAHARGLRAPTEEERERLRFDAAEYALATDDENLRAVALRFLAGPEREAA